MSKVWKYRYQLLPIPRWAKKLGELWATNNRVKVAHIDQPKWTFSGDYFSALRGCCVQKFLHPLEIDQNNLAHTPTRTGVPQKNFNRENLKFGLKFSVWATITPDLVGVSSWNFSGRRAGVITRVQFSEGPPQKNSEGEKNVQNSAQCLTTFDFHREYLRNGSSRRMSENTIIKYNPFHVGPKN